jgi:hypothetical protein
MKPTMRARILHLEDNSQWVREVRLALGEEYETQAAKSLQEALRLLREMDFDLVVVDIDLLSGVGADEEGFRLIKALQEAGILPGSRTIVLSGYTDREARTRRAFRDYGVWDVISKAEFDAEEFKQEVVEPLWGTIPMRIRGPLAQLGVDRVSDIEKVREHLVEIASLGTPLLPEFTLHNHTHSDNLVCLLGRLKEEFGLRLSRYEAFLLVASAYLHDLGMFFDGSAFEEDILPDLATALSFCPQELCDTVANYRFLGQDTGAQIREIHGLLSAYWLCHEVTPIRGINQDDRPYLMAICRGHGKANLRERGCSCYRTVRRDGEEIRVGLLAALLRLVDAMDFYSNRAPVEVFRKNAATFLRNPVSLGHWIKHYFVQDPFVIKSNEGGNLILQCTVYYAVPMRKLNGVRYLDFFRPLFDKHIRDAQKWDLEINEYPPDMTTALGINNIRLVVDERELPGGRDLPTRIMKEIEQTPCKDVLEFLK